jgi:GTP cyclohydrolase I
MELLEANREPTAQLAVVENTQPQRRIDGADWRRYEGYLSEILEAFGLEPNTPGTRETPKRLLRALFDSTSGYDGDPNLVTTFPSEAKTTRAEALGQIVEGPIAFHALCEHHALPFYGIAHVGYVAGDEIIGISKLTRLVRLFSKRFTVQERLGEQIADTLMELVAPAGVAVYLEASHLCTRMRGVEEHSATVTTFWRGAFADPALRQEFLTEVHGRKTVV